MSKAKINYILFPFFFAKALIGARTTLIIFFNITGIRHNVLLCADNPLKYNIDCAVNIMFLLG